MIRLIFIILIFCFPAIVNANPFTVPVYFRHSINSTLHPTLTQAEQALITARQQELANPAWTTSLGFLNFISQTGNTRTYTLRITLTFSDNTSTYNESNFNITQVTQCPNGSTNNNNGTCTCNTPNVYNPTNKQCEAPNPCTSKNGQFITGLDYQGTDNTTQVCKLGCTVNIRDSICSPTAGICSGDGRFNGQQCNPDTNTQTTPEHECIKQGLSYGTVNGSIVCVENGTDNTPPITQKSQADKTVNNPNGSTTTTNTTTNVTNNNVTTTTTTTTTPAGGGEPVTSTESKQQDKKSFCEENPNVEICKIGEGSGKSFGGACGSFSCKGDAIQCAIAKKQHQDRCDDLTENAISNLGANVLSGAVNTANPLSDEFSTQINVPETIQGQDLLPHTGLSNVSFPLGGRSVTLKFAELNEPLALAGRFVVIISYLIGAMIIFGRRA